MKETTLFGVRAACYFVIAMCLLFEGVFLAFSGFPYFMPIRSLIFLIGCLWGITCIAAICEAIRPRPIFVFLAGCLLFIVSAVTGLGSSEERLLDWSLYKHCLELGVIIPSLVLYLLSRKQIHGKPADTV